MASSQANNAASSVERTALLEREGEKYTLELLENGNPVNNFGCLIIDSKDAEIHERLKWFNRRGREKDATYSMVTKGSSFEFEGKRYRVEEDTPFEPANEQERLKKEQELRPESAVSACEKLLDQFWNGEVASLQDFGPLDTALFHDLFKKESKIPCIPGTKRPSLLLCGLENVDTNSAVYKHIEESIAIGPTSIYGTSGAGKTRRTFEYLSKNYGFYFVMDVLMNPGSKDTRSLLGHVQKPNVLAKLPEKIIDAAGRTTNDEKRISVSKANLETVKLHLEILTAARRTVFHCLQERLKQKMSCLQWLLFQLYPEKLLGADIFQLLVNKWFKKGLPNDIPTLSGHMACFIDEAQILKDELPGFFLSHDGNCERSAYKAFVHGFTTLAHTEDFLRYPVFSGTGLALQTLIAEASSYTMKPRQHSLVFFRLDPLGIEQVTSYLKRFLSLENIGPDLVEHVATWLRGRPRWVATFVETFLQRPGKETYRKPPGDFQPAEAPIIEAIDRYIEKATKKEDDPDRRLSWALDGSSAYTMMKTLCTRKAEYVTQPIVMSQVKDAAFKYALSGESITMRDKTAEMIRAGVASVVTAVSEEDAREEVYVDCKIDEPLMVQACINFFDIEVLLEAEMATARGSAHLGSGFEHFILPAIQKNFLNVLKAQLQNDIGDYDNFSVPKVSSYGVLACDYSEDIDGTLGWLRKSMKARFEGTVPPFCFPDTAIGPDMLFFLRTMWFQKRLAVVQGKFKYRINQKGALRTILPSLFYHEQRKLGRNAQAAAVMNKTQRAEWSKIETELFGMEEKEEAEESNKPKTRSSNNKTSETKTKAVKRKKTRSSNNKTSETKTKAVKRKRREEVVRVMVQFPATRTKAAKPGWVPFEREQGTCDHQSSKHDEHDAFLIIDGDNAQTLFGQHSTELLSYIKRRKEKSGEENEESATK